ncbi:MAG: hypothetical protein WBW53_08795, partial [Terriglobales bacterium]
MKPRHAYCAEALLCVALFALVSSVSAQQTTARRHIGAPQDWSDSHIVFSRDALAKHPDLIYREPRVLHQLMQRWHVPNYGAFQAAENLVSAESTSPLGRDWQVKPLGGGLNENMFPAKFTFDPGAPPSCTNDYVVVGLTAAGSATKANLVAFNNLYVNPTGMGEYCSGTAPNVMFAYNITTATGGKIVTDPIISEDGTKIGFVESGGPNGAIFHVLTWTAGQGNIGAPATPTSMVSIPFSGVNSTTSSPWIDYGSDTVYLGSNDGSIYRFTGVFKGTPALSGSPWPVKVSKNLHLSPPVLDSVLHLLLVGAPNGNLYAIDPASASIVGTIAVGAATYTNPGIIATPIVDITNGTTFVVSSNNGTSAVLEQVNTSAFQAMATATIGQGSAGATAVTIYQPALDNNYYNNPSTGLIHVCGTGLTDTTPWHYAFGFTGPMMNETPAAGYPVQLSTTAGDACSGWTEFFNPNIGASPGTDFFFFGLTNDCTFIGGTATAGCVVEISNNNGTINTITAPIAGG